MVKPTWARREAPILEAVLEGEERGRLLDHAAVVQRTGLTELDAMNGLRGLLDAGHVEGIVRESFDLWDVRDLRLLERGRRAIGQWPSEAGSFDTFVRLLGDQVEEESDPAKRSKLEKLLTTTREVGTGVATGVLTAFLRHMAGLG